jgi:hypothetical protein
MKNIPQAYRPSYLWFWPPLILGGSVISAGTIHDLRRVKVPGTVIWDIWFKRVIRDQNKYFDTNYHHFCNWKILSCYDFSKSIYSKITRATQSVADLVKKIRFFKRFEHWQRPSECRIWGLIFQNFLGGGGLRFRSLHHPQFVCLMTQNYLGQIVLYWTVVLCLQNCSRKGQTKKL